MKATEKNFQSIWTQEDEQVQTLIFIILEYFQTEDCRL